jgi:isocitrate dehydrogenase kinase/phosphatase
MSGEVWYPIARGDVFPEEFGTFLLGDPEVRRVFMRYHADLLRPEFWRARQERIRAGVIEDFYPYPLEMRFINRYPHCYQVIQESEAVGG